MLSIIVAMTENRVIGKDQQMPWHLPADLQHFKRVTLGKPIVMGRKTWQSIGRPLPGRRNLIVSRQTDLVLPPGCEQLPDLAAVHALAKKNEELMLIGGAELYRALLPETQRIYLTQIHTELEGDTFFPALDMKQWREAAREFRPADGRNAYHCTFLTLHKL